MSLKVVKMVIQVPEHSIEHVSGLFSYTPWVLHTDQLDTLSPIPNQYWFEDLESEQKDMRQFVNLLELIAPTKVKFITSR